MDTRSDSFPCSAAGVGRFVALVAVLLGFIAMHGLVASNGDGSHRGLLAFSVAPDAHTVSTMAVPPDGLADREAAGPSAITRVRAGSKQPNGPVDGHGTHAAIAGCLVSLCGLVFLALTVPARATLPGRAGEPAALRQQLGAVRPGDPPPRHSPRISLCVLRV